MKRLMASAVVAAFACMALVGRTVHAGDAVPDKKTARLWKAKCGSCHGVDGTAGTDKGRELKVKDMTDPKWQAGRSDEQLRKATLEGVEGMDGYKDDLDAAQVDALIAFMRTFKR